MKAYEKYAKKYIDWNIAMEASMLRVSEAAKLRADIESARTKTLSVAGKTNINLSGEQGGILNNAVNRLMSERSAITTLLGNEEAEGLFGLIKLDEENIDETIAKLEKDLIKYGLNASKLASLSVNTVRNMNQIIAETRIELAEKGSTATNKEVGFMLNRLVS